VAQLMGRASSLATRREAVLVTRHLLASFDADQQF
jgi:hypothetical protein